MFTQFYFTFLFYNWGAIFSPLFSIEQSSNFNLEQNLRDKHCCDPIPRRLIKFFERRR